MGFDGQVLYDDLNFDLPRGGIVGVIGANGAGKTTLFKLITGQLQPLAGEFKVGDTVLVIPGHCCATVNLYDHLHFVRGHELSVEMEIFQKRAVVSRGKAQ